MRKILFAVVFSSFLFLVFTPSQNVSSQTGDKSNKSEDAFYSKEFLKSDYNQVDVVVYANVKSRELIDQIGEGGCEQNKGAGYCLYLLKAEVKAVFKGKVNQENFEFYTTTDAEYPYKEKLSGEKLVFLTWSDNYPNKKMSLGTIENSIRSIEQNVLEKMRKIGKEKSNRKI